MPSAMCGNTKSLIQTQCLDGGVESVAEVGPRPVSDGSSARTAPAAPTAKSAASAALRPFAAPTIARQMRMAVIPQYPCSMTRKRLERLPELDPDRSRLVHEQARPPGRLCRDRAAVAEVRDFVAKVLADQRNLELTAVESDVRIDQPVRGAQSRVARLVIAAVGSADVGVVRVTHHLPLADERRRVLYRPVAGPVGHLIDGRADRLRRLDAGFGDFRVLIAQTERNLEGFRRPCADLQFAALAHRGAGIRNVLKAAGKEDLLLNVLPLDVERGCNDGESVIEPPRLGAELVVP